MTVDNLDLDEVEQNAPYRFSVELVSNAASGSKVVQNIRLVEGRTRRETVDMKETWPAGIYSLSHIALPFSPDDPVYGEDGSSVGSHTPRGERKVLYLSPDYFLRLRYNPFFEWQQEQITSWLGSVVQYPVQTTDES